MSHEEPKPLSKDFRPANNVVERSLQTVIFGSRWLLVPQYLCLIILLAGYTGVFCYRLCVQMLHPEFWVNGEEVILAILGFVDATMVSNLVTMIVIGGYSSFIRKIEFEEFSNRPQGYGSLNSMTLKIKMTVSLVSISAISLVRVFMDEAQHHEAVSWSMAGMLLVIHVVFLLSSYVLALVDRKMHEGEHHE